MSGVKYDSEKIQPALVLETMARALTAVSEVGTFGASKYSTDNWLLVPDALSRYRNAKHRHMLAAATGETHDPESGLLHAAHEAWNALDTLELILRDHTEGDHKMASPAPADWDAGEARIDRIAASAGDGEHYDVLALPGDAGVPGWARFISVLDNGQTVAHQHRPKLVDEGGFLCWHPQGANKFLGTSKDSLFGLYRFVGEHWLMAESVE